MKGYLLGMPIDKEPVKGRGAAVQVPNRFLKRHYAEEHWEAIDEPMELGARTRYLVEEPRTIVNKVNSADLPFVYSLNPYQGCEHGCSYCYARPTHEYWGYGAGLDFEQVIIVKRNAPELLEQTLRHPKWQVEPISISGATDPYQPIERKEQLTRRILQTALDFKQPVSLITKNALVLRDLDVLKELAAHELVGVAISLTTLNEDLRRTLEPRTSTAAQRLRAMGTLREAGIPVMAMIAPIIPALNETEVPALLKAAAEAGAMTASYTLLRTNGAVRPVFEQWLLDHFPDRAARIMAQTKASHGGAMNDSVIGRRMRGSGVYAENINRVFSIMRKRYFGTRTMPALAREHFRPPPKGQLGLFDQ